MRRDLNLIKKILLAIEEKYVNSPLINLPIDGYSLQQVANHCELLHEEGLISKYKGYYGDGLIEAFSVGNLTNEGFNYLDTIRDSDDLESHKKFIVEIDQSTNINSKKLKVKDSIIGDSNKQKIDKTVKTEVNLKFPKIT